MLSKETPMRRLILLAAVLFTVGPALAQTPTGPGDRAFVVFFQEWSAALDPAAIGVIRDVATLGKANPQNKILIHGFADPTGSARSNSLVSALRAELVASQLVADGIPEAMIVKEALGATDFALNPQESRRVTLRLAPGK